MFGVPAWAGRVRRGVCRGRRVDPHLAAAALVVLAVLDTTSDAPRNAAVSRLFVVFCTVEILWWPRVRDRLVVNAEHTAQSSQ
jgi:hypothetical protein